MYIKALMRVDQAKDMCPNRGKWKTLDPFYPEEKRADSVCICCFITKYLYLYILSNGTVLLETVWFGYRNFNYL